MSELRALVINDLEKENLREADWHELLARLVDYGVICRDESQIEADLYDRFVRIESLVDEYLGLLGLRTFHDARCQYVRLIPPGARISGVDDEQDEPFNGGIRTRLSQIEVCVLLTLRTEYDKALREGQVDEKGYINLSLEALVLGIKNLLARNLPENQQERKQLFKRLRQLRVIKLSSDADLFDADSWLKVHPMILHLVDSSVIEELLTNLPSDSAVPVDVDGIGGQQTETVEAGTELGYEGSDDRSMFSRVEED